MCLLSYCPLLSLQVIRRNKKSERWLAHPRASTLPALPDLTQQLQQNLFSALCTIMMRFFTKESHTVLFQISLAFAPHREKWYIVTTVNRSPVTILSWDVLVLVIALSAQVCLVNRVHNHVYPMYTHHT